MTDPFRQLCDGSVAVFLDSDAATFCTGADLLARGGLAGR